MPDKRRLVTSKVCFGSEKAGLLDHSYNKCALTKLKNFRPWDGIQDSDTGIKVGREVRFDPRLQQ